MPKGKYKVSKKGRKKSVKRGKKNGSKKTRAGSWGMTGRGVRK